MAGTRQHCQMMRVAGNRGATTPGVDGVTTADVEQRLGVPGFLDELRISLKEGSFRPIPVRQRSIPKPGGSGKLRAGGVAGSLEDPQANIVVIPYLTELNTFTGNPRYHNVRNRWFRDSYL